MKSWILIPVMMFTAISLGCQSGDPVVSVDESNEEMNKAMETARSTFPQFIKNWEAPSNMATSIKFGLPTRDDRVEHIWFEPIEINGDSIKASCGNDPVNIDGLKLGDVRTFKASELSDWMILSGNKCYGGYTVRVMAKMDPKNAPPFEFADFE